MCYHKCVSKLHSRLFVSISFCLPGTPEQYKGPLQTQPCVLCVVRRCAPSAAGIIPSVQISPNYCLLQTIENNSVQLGLAILLPYCEWFQFSLVMVQDAEESQTRNEIANHGDYPPQCGEESPEQDEEGRREGDKLLFCLRSVEVKGYAAFQGDCN